MHHYTTVNDTFTSMVLLVDFFLLLVPIFTAPCLPTKVDMPVEVLVGRVMIVLKGLGTVDYLCQ